MSIKDRIFGKEKVQAMNIGKETAAGMDDSQMLGMLGGMFDQMIKSVPLVEFKKIKEKNPGAKIIPIMEPEEIEHEEAKEILGLVKLFDGSVPAELKNGAYKIAFGIAYKLDTEDEFREKYNAFLDRIVEFRTKRKVANLEHDTIKAN